MGFAKIDIGQLSMEVRGNYVMLKKLVIKDLNGLMLPEQHSLDREPIQNAVIVGLGPVAHEHGYRHGMHVLFRRGSASEFTFLGDKILCIFDTEIVSVKTDEPFPGYDDE